MTEANFSTVRQSANFPRSSTALLDETAPSSCPSRRARPRVSRALFRPARSNCACSPISPHDPPAERSDVGVDEGPRAAVRLASFRRARLRTLASFAESPIEDHLDIRLIRDVSPEPLIELGLVSRHDVKLTHACFTSHLIAEFETLNAPSKGMTFEGTTTGSSSRYAFSLY